MSEKTSKKELLSLSSCYTHALTLDAIFSALSCLKEIIESSYEKETIYTGPSGPWGRRLTPVSFSMKRLGVFLLPSGWDASPSQGYPQLICWYPFIHLGEEKYCESKVSCLRTQQTRSGVERTNHEAIAPLRIMKNKLENRRKKNNCFSTGFLADFSLYYLVHNLLS